MLQQLENSLEDLTAQVTAQVVWHCRVPRAAKEIMDCLGLKHWKTFRTNYLQPLLDAGWLEMAIPDKPTSSKQKYRLTLRGRQLLSELEEGRS
jgi:ATP-dependent DNA helicase RecG